MGEFASITLHFALCLAVSEEPSFHINEMAKRFKEQTKCLHVKKTMNYILRHLPNADNVEIVTHYVKLHDEAGLFKTK